MQLPAEYSWLAKEPGPKILIEALKLFGEKETAGDKDNPNILSWADELGIKNYQHDSIAWCGLFMAIVAHRAGKTVVAEPLWARNWLRFGEPCAPELGAVLVFWRDDKPGDHKFAHVGIYAAEDEHYYHVIGGNQQDSVRVSKILKKRLLGARAQYKTAKPANVRKVILASLDDNSAAGVSVNEK